MQRVVVRWTWIALTALLVVAGHVLRIGGRGCGDDHAGCEATCPCGDDVRSCCEAGDEEGGDGNRAAMRSPTCTCDHALPVAIAVAKDAKLGLPGDARVVLPDLELGSRRFERSLSTLPTRREWPEPPPPRIA